MSAFLLRALRALFTFCGVSASAGVAAGTDSGVHARPSPAAEPLGQKFDTPTPYLPLAEPSRSNSLADPEVFEFDYAMFDIFGIWNEEISREVEKREAALKVKVFRAWLRALPPEEARGIVEGLHRGLDC